MRVANIALVFVMAIVLARHLGVEGYGVYSYVLALVSLIAIPAQLGLPALVVRETAKAEAERDWGRLRGVWRWAGLTASAFSLLLAITAGSLAWLFAGSFRNVELAAFVWGAAFVPLVALESLRGAALRGLRKVVQGQLPSQIIRPALLIIIVLIYGAYIQHPVRADYAMAFNVLAAAIAFAIGAWLLKRERPQALVDDCSRPVYESRRWLKSALPFAFISGLLFINTQTDIVMLGWFRTAQDVGVYSIAAKGAILAMFGSKIIDMVARPYFAKLYAGNETKTIQRLATVSGRIGFSLAILVTIVVVLLGKAMLQFVFGSEYVVGYPALVILVCAQLVRAGCGIPNVLLEMSGHEHLTAKVMGLVACSNIILNLVLIPLFGMEGAALATACTVLISGGALSCMVRTRLGVDCSALGLLANRR
nr:flippase [Salinisphaera orenii]